MLLSTFATRKETEAVENPDANQALDTISITNKQTVVISDDEQLVDLQRLLDIVSSLDFNTVKKASPENHQILDILHDLFPNIPKSKLALIEKNVAMRMEQNAKAIEQIQSAPASENNYVFVKLSLSIATTIASLYFGGALAAKGTETLITQVYTILFGTPNPNGLAYTLLGPAKNFLTSLALQHGGYALAIVAAPTTYNLSTVGVFICKKMAFLSRLMTRKSASSIDDIIGDFEMLTITSGSTKKEESLEIDDFIMITPQSLVCHDYMSGKQAAIDVEATVNVSLPQKITTKAPASGLK